MNKAAEIFQYGTIVTQEIPLLSKNDFKLILIFNQQNRHRVEDSKRYLTDVHITYKGKKIVKNYVDVNRFITSIKTYTDKKNYFVNKDNFFEPKTELNIKTLQCNFDTSRYIDMNEAMQMNKIFYDAFHGYSKVYLFDQYITEIIDLKTKETLPKRFLKKFFRVQ